VSVTPGVALNFSLDFALREVQGGGGLGTVITLLLDGGIVDQLTLDVTSAPFFGSFGGTFTPTSNQVLWEMVVNRPTNFATGHGQVFFDNAILVPEAGSIIPVMSPAGLLVFAAGLLGFIGYYRRHS